ncbi:response regulator [Dyadobacter tibetensis]|uniref:response regulator n=1 Tax=Dyadobacter tibetensis TaxID=1211851 RepID=UPI00046EF710|nr:response regulator transcription factor [Dyadobacter tibetensis]
MKHILVVDDHPLLRVALGNTIRNLLFQVALKEASDFFEAQEILSEQSMDLIILDLSIPNGKEVDMIASFRRIQDKVCILIYSGRDERIHAPYYINQGANGYISKLSDEKQIIIAITKVLKGDVYLNQEIKSQILFSMVENKQYVFNPIHTLTVREREIVMLLLKGHTVKETAELIGLNMSTVSSHKVRILEKLHVDNFMELVKLMWTYNDELVVTSSSK